MWVPIIHQMLAGLTTSFETENETILFQPCPFQRSHEDSRVSASASQIAAHGDQDHGALTDPPPCSHHGIVVPMLHPRRSGLGLCAMRTDNQTYYGPLRTGDDPVPFSTSGGSDRPDPCSCNYSALEARGKCSVAREVPEIIPWPE